MEQLERALIDYAEHNVKYTSVEMDNEYYQVHTVSKTDFMDYIELYHKDALADAQRLQAVFSVIIKITESNLTSRAKLLGIFDNSGDAEKAIAKNLKKAVVRSV